MSAIQSGFFWGYVSILLKSITFSNEKKQNNVLVFPTSIVNFIK